MIGLFWVLGAAIVLGVAFTLYAQDRKGWNKIAKRGAKIVQAKITPKDRTAEIEAAQDWDAQFSGKPKAVEVKTEPKHVIVKTYMETVSIYEFAVAVCKCGAKYRSSTGVYGQEGARSDARKDINAHIKEANKSEKLLAESGGKFEF